MRNSQRAVVGALGLVVAIMVVFAAWVHLTAEPLPELSGQRTSRTFDHTGFDGVEVSGQWQVNVERGDSWRVSLDVPAELIDEVETELRGDRLSIAFEGGWCAGCFRDGLELKATVTMPALESLDISGTSFVRFSGFEGTNLSLDLSGAGEIRGVASRFEALRLDMSGAANVELADVPVRDANVDISGAGNVTLRMTGGRLSGDLSGAANLEYYGTVSAETVDRSGMVNVRHRD
jgi:Putative auto-transporter adhesin, head GIN domain